MCLMVSPWWKGWGKKQSVQLLCVAGGPRACDVGSFGWEKGTGKEGRSLLSPSPAVTVTQSQLLTSAGRSSSSREGDKSSVLSPVHSARGEQGAGTKRRSGNRALLSLTSPVPLGHVPCTAGPEECCWHLSPVPFWSVCPFSWSRVKPSLCVCLLSLVGIEKQGGLFGERHSLG